MVSKAYESCGGPCIRGSDVGVYVKGDPVAYAYPFCEVHGDRLEMVGKCRDVLEEVLNERMRQEEKWGEQNHPDGTGPGVELDNRHGLYMDELANVHKNNTDLAAKYGDLTYKDIFLEEVFEALAEEDKEKLREELVQTAAVAVAWIEKIDRDLSK